MVDRPTINDLARQAGVSVATVDRVLNRRLPVRSDTVERVVKAAEAIGYHATGLLKRRMTEMPQRKFAFLLQKPDAFYSKFAKDLAAATKASREIEGKPIVDFMEELSPQVIADRIRQVAPKADAVAIVAMDHPTVNAAVSEVVQAGTPVFTLLSQVAAADCSGHLGLDARRCGRIAGWWISRLARKSGKIGILLGSHRYLNQEQAEISFRTYMREHAPQFQLLEPILNFDDEKISYDAVSAMLKKTPDLVGIYEAGGGMAGLIKALREFQGPRPIAVCNELTEATRAALNDDVIDLALGTPTADLAKKLVEMMARACNAAEVPHYAPVVLPPVILMRENI